MSLSRPSTDKEYEARWDAETLANAKKIEADPARLTSAQDAAKAMVEQRDEDHRAMREVAGAKPSPVQKQKQAPGIKQAVTTNAARKPSGNGYNVFQKI